MFLNRKLTRPLVFFDFETTDKDAKKAKIVEYAFLKVMPDGSEYRLHNYVNPGVPIPAEATAIHGISNDAVADCLPFSGHAQEIYAFIKDCDLAGYNSNKYDIPILARELESVGIELDVKSINVVDVRNAFVRKEERTLSAAYKFYTNRDLDDAHSAMIDVVATKVILEEQFWRYKEDFPSTIEELALFTNYGIKMYDPTGTLYRDEEGVVRFAMGKHKDDPIATQRGYLIWMKTAGFPESVLKIIKPYI